MIFFQDYINTLFFKVICIYMYPSYEFIDEACKWKNQKLKLCKLT